MSRSPRFDAVFMDFYGTVAADDHATVDRACRRVVEDLQLPITGPELAVLWGRHFFKAADASNHGAFRTLYECECASLLSALAEFNCTADPRPYADMLQEYWRRPPLHEEALAAFERIKAPICCVSNIDTADLASAIEMHRLKFDAIVTSEDARCYKPDPEIFNFALRKLGWRPDRVFHVGDSLHSDIRGAAAAGLTTVWIHRNGRIFDIGDHPADYTITSLLDLPEIIEG